VCHRAGMMQMIHRAKIRRRSNLLLSDGEEATMRSKLSTGAVIATLVVIPAGIGQAFGQDKLPATLSGSAIYRSYCAVCHGPDAKGNGPLAENLRVLPPDLTLLAKRNGGSYPDEKVYRIIDGRNPVKGHGGPEMPVWGDAFKGLHEGYSEAKVKEKIGALVEYLKSIQAPTR
jgi:mono/diheme cytochrome c family protein